MMSGVTPFDEARPTGLPSCRVGPPPRSLGPVALSGHRRPRRCPGETPHTRFIDAWLDLVLDADAAAIAVACKLHVG